MKTTKLKAKFLQTVCWLQNSIVDWGSGYQYFMDKSVNQLYYWTVRFGDAAICSEDGQFVFLYQRFGTKGLLLKNGHILREINRSYYYADITEYPAAFVTFENRTFLIHCPNKYCRLDFEDAETGEIISNLPERNPSDFFHSRLEVSPDGKYLLSKGWSWHPWHSIVLFDIEACIQNPLLLDCGNSAPNVNTEISTASFMDNNCILFGTSNEPPIDDEDEMIVPPKHVAIWNFKTNQIANVVRIQVDFGNLKAINENYAWDLYGFPKIIDLQKGRVIDKSKSINTGLQKSAIYGVTEVELPCIAYNSSSKKLAVIDNGKIIILEHSSL